MALSIEVGAGDIDRHGHVNNSVYLRWVEQAVHAHWLAGANAEEAATLDWIAVRHEIDYRKPALLDEHLTAAVTLTSVRRARAWYRTLILRDEEVLVEAVSCWCCIDSATQRLTVIPEEATRRFMAAQETSVQAAA